MAKLKPALLLVLVFVAGMSVGVVGTRAAVRHWVRQAVRSPVFLRERIERDLERRLNLEATQKAKVRQVLVQTQEQIHSLRVEFQPRLAAILGRARGDVSAILTPEQREKFDQMPVGNQSWWNPD